ALCAPILRNFDLPARTCRCTLAMHSGQQRTHDSKKGALAIILARAGSKGCPGKNVAPLGGKPCIQWTIEDAQAASGVGRIVVSTAGEEIAAVARSCAVEVVDRRRLLASDTARIDGAARHAVEAVGWREGRVVILYSNVPLRPAGLIDRALDLLISSGAD